MSPKIIQPHIWNKALQAVQRGVSSLSWFSGPPHLEVRDHQTSVLSISAGDQSSVLISSPLSSRFELLESLYVSLPIRSGCHVLLFPKAFCTPSPWRNVRGSLEKHQLLCMSEPAYTGCPQMAIFYRHYTAQRPFVCGLGEQEESALWYDTCH